MNGRLEAGYPVEKVVGIVQTILAFAVVGGGDRRGQINRVYFLL